MQVSNIQLLDFFVELESQLASACPSSVDYFPVIRSFVYSSQRPNFDLGTSATSVFESLRRSAGIVGSCTRIVRSPLTRTADRLLFVAPARHRNIRLDREYVSKHLDSLVGAYGDGNELVWEVGHNPALPKRAVAPPLDVSRLAGVASRIQPLPGELGRIGAVIRDLLRASAHPLDFDCRQLLQVLHAHELSSAYYGRLFARSRPRRAYFVVYYGLRHLSVIAALNELGVETIEYQHGIQNDTHPIYTRWEHLPRAPKAIPTRMLLWDEVARARIDRWAGRLGIATQVTGNLWYANRRQLRARQGRCILVALQIYPEYFNHEILKVVAQTTHLSWLFREHPIYRLEARHRRQLLRDYPNIEIVSPEEELLEESFSRSRCCVTGYSTVGVEALMFGLKTIFADPHARDGLGGYIDGKQCVYADRADDILREVDGVHG